MRMLVATSILLTLALGACAAAIDAKAEGGEDEAPLDGKADGFRSPTEHGTLVFDADNNAALTADEHFHAWEFALSGNAEVELEVSAGAPNLDTVMYLYRRDVGTTRWGAYISRNDDYEQSMLSRIGKSLDAGEYRIIVKGFKDSQRGAFTTTGTCTGRGCATGPTGDTEIPAATGFGAGCVDSLFTSLGANVRSIASFSVAPSATTGFDREVLVATRHYGTEVSEWRDYADDADEFAFEVSLTRTENGAIVEMADGGDESTTYYAFDAAGGLLSYFVSNQSPWTEFYCAAPGDDMIEAPTEDCVYAWMKLGPHAVGSVSSRHTTFEPGGPNTGIDELAQLAIARYQANELDGATDQAITVELTEWASPEDGKGAGVLLSAAGAAAVSYTVVGSDWDSPWIVFESRDSSDEGMAMVCAR